MDDDVRVEAEYVPEMALAQASIQNTAYMSAFPGGLYPNDPAEKLRFQAQQCLQVLREAHRIRQNATMMSAIRDLIRHDRDELAAVLDGET